MGRERSIGDLVARLLAGMGAPEILPYVAIRSAWGSIVGPELARVCRPESLSGGGLMVVVSHPTWAQHLSFLRDTLLANIRRDVPSARVDAVSFRIGRMETRSGHRTAAATAPAPLTADEEREIEAATARIEDPGVRSSVGAALRAALAAAPDRFTAGAADSSRS